MDDSPPIGPKPRQARGAAARRKVYEAAIQEFSERGVETARIEDIVERANVSWGTFYRWFPRKQDVLLEAAIQHVRDRVFPIVEAGLRPPGRPSDEISLEAILALLQPGAQPAHLHGEMLREVIENRDRFTKMLDEGEYPLVQLFAQVIAHGQERGEVRRDIDPFSLTGVLIAGTVFTAVHGYYGAFRGFPGVTPAVDLADMITRFFGVIWRGFEPAPAPITGQ